MRKGICLILTLLMLLTSFTACLGDGEESSGTEAAQSTENVSEALSEQNSETETQEVEAEIEMSPKTELISFVNYTTMQRDMWDLKKENSVAVSFTVPDGELKEFYLNLTNEMDYVHCNYIVDIYSFDEDYNSTVKSEPVYSKQITSMLKTYTLKFEDGQIPAGDYLLEVRLGEGGDGEVYTSVMKDVFWNAFYLPPEYEQYNMRSYVDGKANKKVVMCCAMAIEHDMPVEEYQEGDCIDLKEMGKNTAKVILLAGQSNAVGVSESILLKQQISQKEYDAYANGYSNVKILYRTDKDGVTQNRSDVFVDVKLGQGVSTASFGPEVGLAAYLNEAYPGETFYIIKYAVGGTNTYANWNVNDSTRNQQLLEFKSTIDKGLALLESDGLEPEIVGFLWMQGEGDSVQFYYANGYYERAGALVKYIRELYAEYSAAEEIPFIDAMVNDSGMFASWFLVNAMKLKYTAESGNNYLIDTVSHGLTTLHDNSDYAHYDSLSMLLLGRLFGDRLSRIFNRNEDDGICPHRESGYRIEEDAHAKVCDLCGIDLAWAAHASVGDDVAYDAETKSYKGTCICGKNVYQELFFKCEARATNGGCENMVISTATEVGEDFVRYTQSGGNRVRVYLIFNNTTVTGQYLVLKYRFVNNGTNADLKDAFVASALSENPLARGNGDGCGNLGTMIADGKWHYLVVDLVAKNVASNGSGANLQIIADHNGDYAIKYIRADFTTATADGSCYLDVAYVGFADEADAAERFAQ